MNRDSKTSSTLLALARSRRMQRALAHAFLHRNEPLPSLRSSLGYMMTTTRVGEDAAEPGHRMTVLGVAPFDGVAYIVEEMGAADAPVVYRLYLRGPRQGHLVPLHAWYEHSHTARPGVNDPSAPGSGPEREVRARIAALAPTLEPVRPTATEAWMLSTRIVQRRALRVGGPDSELPIRKFALQLVVEPVSGRGQSGRTTVTAFLHPHAQLTEVWALGGVHSPDGPDDLAIARVTFTGIPSGIGHTKDTVILLTSGLTLDGQDPRA